MLESKIFVRLKTSFKLNRNRFYNFTDNVFISFDPFTAHVFFQRIFRLGIQNHPNNTTLHITLGKPPINNPLRFFDFINLIFKSLLILFNENLHKLKGLLLPQMALQQLENSIKNLSLLLRSQLYFMITRHGR